jgi:hypothetical protein
VFRHVREFVDPTCASSASSAPNPGCSARSPPTSPPDADLVHARRPFTTVVKQRFVEPPSPGKEVRKLFSVNYLDRRTALRQEVQDRILERLVRRGTPAEVDAVLLLTSAMA